MPLAIELAAAWVDTLSLADIVAELQQGLDFLATEMRNVPERHRSMRAVFGVTWQRLSQAERETFPQLSVFRGGFTRQAAQSVTTPPASLRLLATFVGKSLLQYDRARDRYQLHELLRQYAADKLAQDPLNEAAVRDRHTAYYCLAMQQWAADLKGARQQAALAEIEADIKNVQLAWEWTAAQGQVAQLDQAMDGLCLFYEWRGRFQEGEAACQSAASMLANEKWTAPVFQAPTPSGNTQQLLARLLTWQSSFSRILGRTTLASQCLQQSLALLDSPALEDQDTRPERAFAWQQMGHMAFDRANYEEARRLYAQSLTLYRVLDNQWGTADVLLKSGNAAMDASAYEEAKQLVAESLALFQALGNPKGVSQALLLLGEIARYSGVYDEARQRFTQNLDLSQAQGNLWGIAGSLEALGALALFQGKFEAGVQLLQRSIAISREMGDRERLVTSLAVLASAYCFCGEFAPAYTAAEEGVVIGQDQRVSTYALFYATISLTEANTHAGRYEEVRIQSEKALTLARKAGVKYLIGWAHKWLGWVALAEEKYGDAHHFFQEEVANSLAAWHAEWRAWALAGLGRAAYGLGNRSEAQQHLVQALRTAVEIQAFIPLLFLLPVISLLLADEAEVDKKERAIEVYALAASHPFVAKSRLLADIAGRHIAAVAATLPPELVEAAQSRGRTLDWWAAAAELLAELEDAGAAGNKSIHRDPGRVTKLP
jgi:tetratricopeptide (TPR) repeat protein